MLIFILFAKSEQRIRITLKGGVCAISFDDFCFNREARPCHDRGGIMKNPITKCIIALLLTAMLVAMPVASQDFGLEKLDPITGYQGQNLTVAFIGYGFSETTGVGFMPPFGITMRDVKYVSPRQMNAVIYIESTAQIGVRDAIVSSSDGKLFTLAQGFTILEGNPPEPAIKLAVTDMIPKSVTQGQSILARIVGSGFDADTHIFFGRQLSVRTYSPTPANNCGLTKHKQFIEMFSKNKDSTGCHIIVITKKCYVGTCTLAPNHKGDHIYSWVPCKDQSHSTKPVTEKFCTTEEAKNRRNQRYNDLVDQQNAESKEKNGVSVAGLRSISETEMVCTIMAETQAVQATLDLAVLNAQGDMVVLRNALTVEVLEPIPEPMPKLSVKSMMPDRIDQGVSLVARIIGTGFDTDTHISFGQSLEVTLYSVSPTKKCGDSKHKQFLETFSKEKDSTGCHTIVIKKKCYVGTCTLESAHSGKHIYSWIPCKDPAHATQPVTEKFCTTDEAKNRRNQSYNNLVDQQNAETQEKSGVSVERLVPISETELICTLAAATDALPASLDLAVMNAQGEKVVLRNALKTIGSEIIPDTGIKVESFEHGDGWFRIRGTSAKPIPFSGWEPLPLTSDRMPDMDSWGIPPDVLGDLTICIAGTKIVFACSGKIVVQEWMNFLPKAEANQELQVYIRKEGTNVEFMGMVGEHPVKFILTHITMP